MFNRKIDPLELAAQEAIISAIAALKDHNPTSPEYEQIVDQIKVLTESLVPEKPVRKPLSADTIFLGLINILGIGLVLKQEQFNVVTSKAVSLWKKV